MCSAGSRLLVQESVSERVVAKVKERMTHLRVGDSLDKVCGSLSLSLSYMHTPTHTHTLSLLHAHTHTHTLSLSKGFNTFKF